VSNQHSETLDNQPIPAGDEADRRFVRIGELGRTVLHGSERLLIGAGLICVLVYVGTRIYATAMYQAGLWSFSQLKSASTTAKYEEHGRAVDFSLWAGKRITAYKQALATHMRAPLAVLSIPRLRLDVPVFEGTDDLTLNRGAGRIVGTAQPGERGNIAIAAHRDGFFRGLKDVRPGDRIELVQLRRKFVYTVDNISVVNPGDVTVLHARPQASLTLVTCYPFYFIGDAPQRYIVQASLANSEQASLKAASSETDVETSKLNKEKMQ
jgi:sortase A